DGVETATNETTQKIRVLVPKENMAFMPRWLANKSMCSLLQSTSDADEDYRCAYDGHGAALDAAATYYDIGADYVINRFEVGCPYSAAPACAGLTTDGSCIGAAPPTVVAGLVDDTVYYDRSTGDCHV